MDRLKFTEMVATVDADRHILLLLTIAIIILIYKTSNVAELFDKIEIILYIQ